MERELLRKVQLTQLEIAKEIRRVCEENDIPYFLTCGTLLGAVRHQGFIPWDDDMDVGMLRENYEKFCRIAPEKLKPEYCWQINVYQDSHALPIGFCYDTYMTRSEFDEIDPAERAHSMLKTLVVANEDEATVSTILRHYDAALDGKISQENKYADMDKRREACTDVFDYGTDYFYSEITSGSEQYAFFSVPYDKAWSATVNGESAEILNINGLMAVKVNAGKNCIRFHYSPTPLWCGIGVSAISILLTAIYLLAGRRSRKSKKEVL